MTKVADVAHHVQDLLTTAAEAAVQASGFRQRRADLGGPVFVQALVLSALALPDPTLEDYAQAAADADTPVTPQAFHYRFGPTSAACLQHLVEALATRCVTGEPGTLALLNRFQGVHLQDSTLLPFPDALEAEWPGHRQDGQRAGAKLQVRWEVAQGHLRLLVEPARTTDTRTALDAADLPEGALRITDLGYFDLSAFAAIHARKGLWLSRLQANTAVFHAGERVALATWLAQQPGPVVEVAVTLGVKDQLAARLVALPVPAAVAAKRRQRLRTKARKKGRQPSAEQLALCAWTLLVTNLSATQATAAEVAVLYRLRWQIEILFRLWKTEGHLTTSRSAQPWRRVTETFAKLAALVLRHWLLVAGACAWVGRSWWRASKAIRAYAATLISALGDLRRVTTILAAILRRLTRVPKVERRGKHPSAEQLLQNNKQQKVVLA
jgi:Transposase DDE domain